ncbi:MAG: DUF4249 family protein [Bacteroidales bacterium]|nr:DUF4249 family protein [Bacteroidales bacterium]
MLSQARYKPILLFIFLSVCCLFCEEPSDYELNSKGLNFIVVNGLLTNEKKAHEIIISSPVESLNEKPKPVSGLEVYIYNGDSLFTLTENPLNSGIYKTSSDFRAVINRAYTLIIISSDSRYYASAYMLPTTPFNKLKYYFAEDQQMFTIDSVNQVFDLSESALYKVQIDWTNVSGYESLPESSKKATLYYYTLSTIDISELFSPEKEKIYFPAGTIIVESKYSLTPEHASFIRTMLLETEWRGGGFDVAHGNVETNLSKGAFGFFAASTIIRDTIFVE